MSKRMQKDALIVLCLLVLLGIAWSISAHRNARNLTDIVEIADTRSEHLRDRIQALEKRIGDLEEKIVKQVEAIR